MASEGIRKYNIASIGADGIGPEVVNATIDVLKSMQQTLKTFEIEFTELDWGTARYKKTGKYMPDDGLEILKKFDAGLFGAMSLTTSRCGSCFLPFAGQLWANVRPVKNFPNVPSRLAGIKDGDIDWVIVRENSEGEYCGQGGRTHRGHPWEAATELSIFTRVGIERIMRFAFDVARSRPRKLLTVITKSNAMRNGMVLWDEIALEVSADYPDVTWDKVLVDAITVRMVNDPKSLDTLVGTNLHMDIISDLAAALGGSIGIAPSSNLDPTRKNPSLFEPVHGSAFDITGKGVANPVATLWSASEMLQWIGEEEAADILFQAVQDVCSQGICTPDLGGTANTKQVAEAVVAQIKKIHETKVLARI